MIQKHAIPILEFDDNPQAVIMPNHEGLDLQLPKKCVYAFLGEEIDRYAREVGANCVGEFVSAWHLLVIWKCSQRLLLPLSEFWMIEGFLMKKS